MHFFHMQKYGKQKLIFDPYHENFSLDQNVLLTFLFLDHVSHIHSLSTILGNEGSILSLKGPIW